MARVAPHLPERTTELIFSQASRWRGAARSASCAWAPQSAANRVAPAFVQVDDDADGKVSYKDFHQMMSARPGGRRPIWPAPVGAASMETGGSALRLDAPVGP